MPVTTPVVTTQNDSRHCYMSPARQNCSQVRTTALTHQTSPATVGGDPRLDPAVDQGLAPAASRDPGTRAKARAHGAARQGGGVHTETPLQVPTAHHATSPASSFPAPSPSSLMKHRAVGGSHRPPGAGRRCENSRFRGCGGILTKQRYCAEVE